MRLWQVVVFCGAIGATANAAPREEFTGREYAETVLALSPSDFEVRLAAKSVYRRGSGHPLTMDLLAEGIWAACSGRREMHPDALSWAAKALGASRKARYAGLIDLCLANVGHRNTIKHLQEARASLDGPATGPFVGGTIDFGQVRGRLGGSTETAGTAQRAERFRALRQDRPIEEIYSALGRPAEVKGVNVPGRKIGHTVVKVRTSRDMMVFVYGGFGQLRFAYDKDKNDWLLADAKPEQGPPWVHGAGRFGTLDDQITEGDVGDLGDALRQLRKLDRIEKTTLDRIAGRIYASHQTEDSDMADRIAWLCRILGTSGDGRYKKFLTEISTVAAAKAVKRHAGQAAEALPETSADPYVAVRVGA